MNEHVIKSTASGSISDSLGIAAGDILLSVNGEDIEDIFDYQYQCESTSVDIEIRKSDGSVIIPELDYYSFDYAENDTYTVQLKNGETCKLNNKGEIIEN